MQAKEQLATPTYDPNNLIAAVINHLKLKNDAALARELDLYPSAISKIRHKTVGVGPDMLLRLHDITGLPVNALRRLAGLPIVEARVPAEV